MKVKARDGLKVPYEHRANQYIEGDTVDIPASPYYLRQIKTGDLIEVEDRPKATRRQTAKEEQKDGE